MKKFNDLASLYDFLANPEERLHKESPFLSSLITPGMKVLDLACGTGIHSYYFAEKGAQVTAMDISDKMIAYAKQNRSHSNIKYYVKDMRDLFPDQFDLIICLGNSINLLESTWAVNKMFLSIPEILKPKGKLLLQVINPESPKYQKNKLIVKTAFLEKKQIVVTKSMIPYNKKHLVTITYFIFSQEQESPQIISEAFSLLDLTEKNLKITFPENIYSNINWYGGMDASKFTKDTSSDIVILAQK